MKTATKYLLLTIIFAYISSGVVISAFQDAYDSIGCRIFWMLLPMTAFFMLAVVINDCLLVPRLLLKRRYALYCAAVFAVSFSVALLGLLAEYRLRVALGLPMRIYNYSSPLILIDSFGNSFMVSLILLSLGVWPLYLKLCRELREEAKITEKLRDYMDVINRRLNPERIIEGMSGIADALKSTPDLAVGRIRELCDYLRNQLYELPRPPELPAVRPQDTDFSKAASMLVDRRFRLRRNLLFLLTLAVISTGAIFPAPDNPEFNFDGVMSVVVMFCILVFIAYINILWFYPRFKAKGSLKRYILTVCIFLPLLTVPVGLAQILTYKSNVYDKGMPLITDILATIGSLLTLTLYVGGISAILLLQDRIRTQRRLVKLRSETVRQEYVWLRRQINPHFLFNVLNNIGITAYDNPEESVEMMDSLIQMMKYQFRDIRSDYTSVVDEVRFLESYLALEKSRREHFRFSIDHSKCSGDKRVPTLIFIPFVENAAKYTSRADGDVTVVFRREKEKLIFECVNPFDPEEVRRRSKGGIGIANTRRRLSLMYEGDYSLHAGPSGDKFVVKLEIPMK